jgi:hypothetical protein
VIRPPYIFPTHVPNRLVVKEIAYQTTLYGFNTYLSKYQKKLYPPYPLFIDLYGITNSIEETMKREKMEIYHFPLERYKIHNPPKIVEKHKSDVNIAFTYTHKKN